MIRSSLRNNEHRIFDCRSAMGPRLLEVVIYCRSLGRHFVLQCILESFASATGGRVAGRIIRAHHGYWILRWRIWLLALELPGASASLARKRPDSQKRCGDNMFARCQLLSPTGHGLAEFYSRTHGNGGVG